MDKYDWEEIKYIVAIICAAIYLVFTTCLIHFDIAKHEENETMLEKYRIEMQYLGEEKVEKGGK